jgi:transposase
MLHTIICGMDAHDNTLTNRIGVDREAAESMTVRNTQEGREKLFQSLKDLAQEHEGARIVVAYEASPIGFGIYDECVAAGIECHILAPTKIPKSLMDRKRKHDKADAQKIFELLKGHVLAGNALPDIWIPDHQTRDDREIVRSRLDAGEKLTALKTQVQMVLKRNHVVKPDFIGVSWMKPHRRWLWEVELKPGARIALSSLLRQIASVEEEIKELDKQIDVLSQTKRYQLPAEALVVQIKGVGLLTAMVFLTEIGDMRRFSNRRQVGSFLGLAPSCRESGEGSDRKGHITREGPARVRKALCQASWVRTVYDVKEARVYERIVEKNPKHKKIAIVACMRRLGILMWHLAKDAQMKTEVFEDVQQVAACAQTA